MHRRTACIGQRSRLAEISASANRGSQMSHTEHAAKIINARSRPRNSHRPLSTTATCLHIPQHRRSESCYCEDSKVDFSTQSRYVVYAKTHPDQRSPQSSKRYLWRPRSLEEKESKTKQKKDNNHLVTRRPYTRIRTITPSPPSSLSYTGSFQPPIAVYYRTISVSNPVSPEATSFQRKKARSPPTSTEARTFIGFLSMDTAALRAEVEGSSQKQFLACWKEKERGRLCSALRKGRPFHSPTRTRRRSE